MTLQATRNRAGLLGSSRPLLEMRISPRDLLSAAINPGQPHRNDRAFAGNIPLAPAPQHPMESDEALASAHVAV